MKTVYIEDVFILNLTIDFLIMAVAVILYGSKFSWRAIFSALYGAVYAAIAPLAFNILLSIPFKLISAAIMAFIAFGWKNKRKFIKAYLCVWGSTVIINGTAFAIMGLLGSGLEFDGGFLRLSTPHWPQMAIAAAAAALMLLIIPKVIAHFTIRGCYKEVTITTNKGSIKLRAIIDTGNALTQAITGLPIMVASRNAIETILPESFKGGNDYKIFPVAYISVGKHGVLLAFKPDSLMVESKQIDALVAVYDGDFSGERAYDALLHPLMAR